MQNNDFRAKQFAPFDSLKGFYDLIKNQEFQKKNKKSLTDDAYSILNERIKNIKTGDSILIEYYYNQDYIETNGIVKKIDEINKCIYVSNSKINFDDIMYILKK